MSDAPSVQEQLDDAYQGAIEADWRYVVVGLGIVGAWWLVFNPISAFGAAFGLIAFGWGFSSATTALASTRWPTTEATVLESTVFTKRELRDRFPGLARQAFDTTGGYVPFVRYRYTVDDETHVGVRVSPFDGPITRRGWAESITDDYVENDYVSVRYDPDAPGRAFLSTWMRSKKLLFWVFGSIGFFGFAVWAALEFPHPPVLGYIFAGLFALLGLRKFVLGLRTRRWPSTGGTVLAQKVRSISSDHGSTSYHPKLRYEYTVDGTTYVSSRYAVRSGPSFNTRSKAESWLEEFTRNDTVTVHYNPGSPDRSVLEPGGALGGFVLFVVGLTLLGALVVLTTNVSVPVEQLPIGLG